MGGLLVVGISEFITTENLLIIVKRNSGIKVILMSSKVNNFASFLRQSGQRAFKIYKYHEV